MRVEMNAADENRLNLAFEGGPIPAAVYDRYMRAKRRLLLMGSAGPMSNEMIAQICESSAGYEPPLLLDEPQRPRDRVPTLTEVEGITNPEETSYGSANGNGAYAGPVSVAQKKFKSKPGTPWKKVERDRPLSYMSDKDNARHAGWFVKVHPDKKDHIIIRSSESRKNFGILAINAELSDLTTISREPRAVQI